ncbi:Anillin [Pseudolycoriella hygida]|uniref:Anillin n=1 Tax=Pseudolycoriella hygida TaxID=35572 RepID=A0A9Q0N1H7_9DIPT|nr:Anillin [Pseudolycoriella hygida]
MVKESESRFCSNQQTILDALDPIHRSLLMNNSEFESINKSQIVSPNQCLSTNRSHRQPQQQRQEQMMQQLDLKGSTQNKQYYMLSYSEKPDATCACDNDCSKMSNEHFNVPCESQYSVPWNGRKKNMNKMQSKKNVQVRISSHKNRFDERMQLMSSCSPTDSSTYDSESESAATRRNANRRRESISVGSSNSEISSDYHCESSSSDEITSTTDPTAPMIKIVQELTQDRTVVSTIQINKKKVNNFQKSKVDSVPVASNDKPKWKNRQKIIDDNVCNEMLDATSEKDFNNQEKKNSENTVIYSADNIIMGELKAKPKRLPQTMGKLLESRLSRINSENLLMSPNYKLLDSSIASPPASPTSLSARKFQPPKTVPLKSKPLKPSRKPPAKPPRTFTYSSSKTSTDSIGGNTATTLPVDDLNKPTTFQNSSQMSPGGGWAYKKVDSTTTVPTCPTLDDINDFEKTKKIGWVSSMPQREDFLQVFNMLKDDFASASKITTANLTPEPQFRKKEDIDQVDSAVFPKPVFKRQKALSSMDSTCASTPTKRHSVPKSHRSETDVCSKCRHKNMKTRARHSFGKGAIEKTKMFFSASKNMWSKQKQMKRVKSCDDDSGDYEDLDLDKFNMNTTFDFNTNNAAKVDKKTEKYLELTPKQSENSYNVESTRKIIDRFLSSVKRSPPKKPFRQNVLHKDVTRSPSNNEDYFNFNRVVESPKSKDRNFKLSPKKLFFSSAEKQSEIHANSYRSFETEQRDDLKQCIVEYLKNMNEKIEFRSEEELPHLRPRTRTFSTSSEAIDYNPQRDQVVQIDCHPEPTYSKIATSPPKTALSHIMYNDNPNAIYTIVNKTKGPRPVPPTPTNKVYIEDTAFSSTESLDTLSVNNNLADSILNMLEIMTQQKLETSTKKSDSPVSDEQVRTSHFVEPPLMKLTSERFQQSSQPSHFNQEKSSSDGELSIETFDTESLCEDVIRGDSVNNNIVSMIDRLENMDLISAIDVVKSDTDEDFEESVVRTGDDDHYCSIDELDETDGPTLNSKSKKTSETPKNNRLQCEVAAAPSMIEISDQLMLKLTNQIVAQREVRNQLKHAIKICRTTKEFECSSELIEAERLLLLSTKKESCAILELNRIDYEENGLTASPSKCVGTVTIKKIELDLKPEEILEQISHLSYICVCSYRDQVVATQAQERIGNKVKFHDIAIKIEGLNSSFEIQMEVYVLRLPRQLRKYSHESKYHLNKVTKKPLFSNPVKLFSSSAPPSPTPTKDLEESRFRLRGAAIISAKSLSSEKFEIVRKDSWPRNHVYISYNTKSINLKMYDPNTNMTGALRTEFVFELNLCDSGLAGFLIVTDGRRNDSKQEAWCRLTGCTIEISNNENNSVNGKLPTFSIDLTKCTNELFELIEDRFALDVFNDETVGPIHKNRIHRYWISATNQNDLILWLTELNRILKFIKDWNI